MIEHHGIGRLRAPLGTHQGTHVQNDDDPAIAQDGRAGDAANAGYLGPEGLDDDLAAAHQFVGDQRGRMFAGADQHHRHRYVRFRKPGRPQTDERPQLLEAVFLSAVFERWRIPAKVPGDDVARQSHHALHRGERQRVDLFGDAHDQCLADGQRERQTDRETRTLAGGRFDEQPAAQFLHFRGHDVHAHAATGGLRDVTGRAEAGLEDELHGFLVRQLRIAIDESERNRLLADQLHVDSMAVVRDHDDHLRTIPCQADGNAADVRLAERKAALGRLDAVDHGIAQHVLERRHHALEHLPVEFGRRTLHHQLGPLAGVVCRLTHQTRQALHMPLERHHACTHQAVLQFGDHAGLLRQQVLRLPGQRFQQTLDARDVPGGLGKRPGERLQRGIAVELERVEVAAARVLVLVPVEHLRLGLDLQSAQLFLEARDGTGQLRQVEVDGRDLLIEAGAKNAHLTRVVEHGVEQFGIDPGHLDPFRRGVLAAG